MGIISCQAGSFVLFILPSETKYAFVGGRLLKLCLQVAVASQKLVEYIWDNTK